MLWSGLGFSLYRGRIGGGEWGSCEAGLDTGWADFRGLSRQLGSADLAKDAGLDAGAVSASAVSRTSFRAARSPSIYPETRWIHKRS